MTHFDEIYISFMWYVFVEYLPYSRKGAQYWDGVVNVTVRISILMSLHYRQE